MIILLLTVLVADAWLWFALGSDLRHRHRLLRSAVYIIKSLLSVALIYLAARTIFYRGAFDDPANAFRLIAFGALGALLVTAAAAYLIIRMLTWLLNSARRRKPRKNGLAGIIVFCALAALFSDSYFRQRFDVNVVRKEIVIRGLDARLSGMKIVLISDLHLSSWYGHYNRLGSIMNMINNEDPDLLINAGDFVTYGWKEFGRCDTILAEAHGADGTFAVSGNHDDGSYHPRFDNRYSRENDVMLDSLIRSSGYTLLSDTAVYIIHDGARVAIEGLSTHGHHFDISYGDFEHVFRQVPDSLFSILLLHAPSGWDLAMQQDHSPDLTLSGHTHGMQLGLPVPGGYISPASLIHKYWKGLYKNGDHYLYVTTGLGTMGIALRMFMPPEIAVLSLTDR